MKWTRAMQHLEALAQTCDEMAAKPSSIIPLRVVQLWAARDILGPVGDVESLTVALVVELPADDVPWLTEPPGARQWANATRLAKNPVVPLWRSAEKPVWNHHIDRPALIWDAVDGVAEDTVAALRDGQGERFRLAAPAPEELRSRLDDELAVSLRALRRRTAEYEERRWRPGKLEPVADALWSTGQGYLDVLDALG